MNMNYFDWETLLLEIMIILNKKFVKAVINYPKSNQRKEGKKVRSRSPMISPPFCTNLKQSVCLSQIHNSQLLGSDPEVNSNHRSK